MPKKNLTVKEVAAKAGVSTATISRVLNGDPKVRPATAEKVKKVIKQSGYRMNQTARSLKTRRTHTIGIVAPEFKNEFFMSIVTGIEDMLKNEGYSVVLCSSQESIDEEKDRLKLLKEKNVDGTIIIPGSSEGEHFNLMGETPVVLVDRLVQGFSSDAVLSDNFQGSYEAVKSAASKGARRIGFLGGDMELTSAKERYEGFNKACQDFSIQADEDLILFGNYHEDSGYKLMKQLMEHTSPPDYIFISNYFMHLGAARYLLEAGHDFPGLHILSFDDLPLASFFPCISIIVAQPMEEIGRKAAELLLGRIRGDMSEHKTIRLETKMRMLE
ncbi:MULTISPECIES: LacI family DNA-binding transcriptional regulator [unclassified Oceanispirochaeta]|uniref:LacI family DNA-binding transcriptional regulator n=1 Tax=unclassified Oceanispirochaeta TaxID=2635722 RepID=UPI000E095B2C|nr:MULTISPECIES: LacI family DNA-binding transcriptional regulator [unclassified Oceanispirochaeta]MBF9014460.1 LacI family DNA-binding transcriptional regulator [Oceanispirochaeta sp. M2]NPD70716.1 LacI family transcriptional regulator [Oceanispirochaeta sp. M1]RDG34000.1 LacI family transcriptional regulator [Oceanispirochaeta sp. M1]